MSDHVDAPSPGDELIFAEERAPADEGPRRAPWKVLIVDDENEIHSLTRLVLEGFTFEGRELELNYATGAAGHVGIELQDGSGVPIEGYRLEDADLLIGDEIERVVSWQDQSDVSRLAGEAVRLRIQLKDADVYSFRFMS